MLTPKDTHYLVGLLSRASNDEDIQIDLGERIPDISTGEERDVDVTITKRNPDGSISQYRGIEVKKHRRALTVEQVEQLCIKFADLPTITDKAIVSASGYTKAAVKKAKYHGVDLLEIKESPDPVMGFGVEFSKGCLRMTENCITWKGAPEVVLVVDPVDSEEVRAVMKHNPVVVDKDGRQHDEVGTLTGLMNGATTRVLTSFSESNPMQPNEIREVSGAISFPQEAQYIQTNGGRIPIREIQVRGEAVKTVIHHPPELRVLKNIHEEKPIAGCAIFELKDGSLRGMSVSNANANINSFLISPQDRLGKKIYKQRID